MPKVRWISVAAAAAIVTLAILIVTSSVEMPLAAGLRAVVGTRWGITTMVDLYFGLFAVAGWIAYRERSVPRALGWFVALCLLGNLITVVYLFIASRRARTFADLFRPVLE